MALEEAIERVARMIGMAIEWTELAAFLPDHGDPQYRRSALASSFRRGAGAGPARHARDRAGRAVRAAEAAQRGMIDEYLRAVEATLFASATPLTPDEIALHAGEGDVARGACGARRALCRARDRPGRARRALAFPDRARSRAPPAPHPRGAAPAVAGGDRDAGDHRLSRAGQPGRDRGDPRRPNLQGHARRADGGGLGPPGRPARRAGAAVALRDHAGTSSAISASRRAATCRGSTI